jgi:uracil-DNA glycosylase family 4
MQATIDKVIYKYPFYSMTSIGMPPPGPDFIEAAVALGDPEPDFDRGLGGRFLRKCGPILEQLYYQALYVPNFCIKVMVKARPSTPTFIRGHLWGCEVTGPRPAKVMIVGKWPGADEQRWNRNMIGPSGQITARALELAGVAKQEYDSWYVTNLIKFPNLDPTGNRVATNWLKDCLPLLEQELRLVRPDFILALGAEAAKELISDDFRFDIAQGQVFKRLIRISSDEQPEQFKEAKIVACIHPAFVARQADRLPEFQATIRRFVGLTRGEDINEVKEEVDHRLIYTATQLNNLVDSIIAEEKGNEQPIFALDCEWHGDYPTEPGAYLRTIQFSHRPGFAACIVLRGQGGVEVFGPSISDAIQPLRRLLISTSKRPVRIAGHHLRADLPWIIEGFDKELGQALIRQYNGAESPEKTRTEGGFDTMLAAHAVTEAPGKMGFKLEILALSVCGIKRYDGPLQKWKKDYCKQLDISEDDLEGYGECPDDILHPYALWDADATRRLVEAYNRPGGLLDKDQYGNNCREAFWESMRAAPAVLEMEMRGLMIDRKRGEELTHIYTAVKNKLISNLQEMLNWPNFNTNSSPQCRTMLFGHKLAGVIDKDSGEVRDVAPKGAIKLNLTPVKTSGKPARPWAQVVHRKEEHLYRPCADKEVLGILRMQLKEQLKKNPDDPKLKLHHDVVETLRNVRFAGQVIKSVLRPPKWDDDKSAYYMDEDGELVFEKGLLASIQRDGRVRTHIFQTKETGRFSSARPPLQNLSKRRETDYKQILGTDYKYALRSMITASPGYALVEADYLGAELFMMAVQSGDQTMIDHCLRASLKETDLKFYDIHSNIAVSAFKLTIENEEVLKKLEEASGKTAAEMGWKVGDPLPATKWGLKAVGKENLRTAAKTIAFGIPYGRGTEAVIRAVEEEGVKITVAEADIIRDTIFNQYPCLEPYLESCKARVTNPGWMANCFRRYRRFQYTGVADGGDRERQAMNYPIQSGVASAVNRALMYLYNRPDRFTSSGEQRYYHVLQIHDAILFEVRIPDLEWFVDEVLPWGMTQQVHIYQCDHAGNIIPGVEPFHMNIDTAVMLNWGEEIPLEVGTELGIPSRFCAKPKK